MAETIHIKITGDAGSAARAADKARRAIEDLGDSTEVTAESHRTLGRDTERSSRSLNLFNRSALTTQNVLGLIKWPALITGAGAAAQGLSAMGAAAVGLSGALAPLSGALVAYPALLTTLGQAAGVTALAGIKDLTEALGGNEEAMKRLTPEAKRFVDTLKEAEPEYKRLKETAQEPLFRGLERGLDAAMENFPALRSVIGETAEEMGRLAEATGEWLGREGFGRDFETIGRGNARLLGDMGDAGLNLADALRHVLVAAQPFLKWLGNATVTFTQFVEEQARAGRESGRMAGFFEKTRDVMEQLADIGGSVASVLYEIGSAGAPLGRDILDSLEEGADNLERWAESAKGQRDLAEYFEEAKPAIFEMGRLLRDVGEAFVDLGNEKGLAPLIRQLRTELLPALVEMTKDTTKAFGPTLVNAMTEFGKLLSNFLGEAGPLTLFVKGATEAARALNDLFESSEGIADAAVWGISAAGVAKLFGGLGTAAGGAARTGMLGAVGRFVWPAALFIGLEKGIEGALGKGFSDVKFEEYADKFAVTRVLRDQIDAAENLTQRERDLMMKRIKHLREVGRVSKETANGMIEDLKEVNQAQLEENAPGQGFGIAQGIARDGRLVRSEIRKTLDALKKLPEGARDEASEAMIGMARVLERQGRLPKGAAAGLQAFVERRFGDMSEDAIKESADMGRGVARMFEGMKDAATSIIDSLVGGVRRSLGNLSGRELRGAGIRAAGAALGSVFGRQSGGAIPGTQTGDRVPAMLEEGEYVLNRKAVKKIGLAALDQVNFGMAPRFQEGGGVGRRHKLKMREIKALGVFPGWEQKIAAAQDSVAVLDENLLALSTVHSGTEAPSSLEDALSTLGMKQADWGALSPVAQQRVTQLMNTSYGREENERLLEIGQNEQLFDELMRLREYLIRAIEAAQKRMAEIAKAMRKAERDEVEVEGRIKDLRQKVRYDEYLIRTYEKNPKGNRENLKRARGNLRDHSKKLMTAQRAKELAGLRVQGVRDARQSVTDFSEMSTESLHTLQGRAGPMGIPGPPAILGPGLPLYRGEILRVLDELRRLGVSRLVPPQFTSEGPVESDSALADILRQQLLDLQREQNLDRAAIPTLHDFMRSIGAELPYVGAYAKGGVVPETGMALVHKGETVTPAGTTPKINLFVDGSIAPMIDRIRAEIDGYGVQTIDHTIGRRMRQRAR